MRTHVASASHRDYQIHTENPECAHSRNAPWARLPRTRTRARSIQAPPPPHTDINGSGRRPCPRNKHAIWPRRGAGLPRGSRSLRFGLGLLDHGDGGGPYKHAIAHGTVKVALALDTAVILAVAIVQLDANPDARGEGGVADEAHDGIATVGEANDLPFSQVGHFGRGAVVGGLR